MHAGLCKRRGFGRRIVTLSRAGVLAVFLSLAGQAAHAADGGTAPGFVAAGSTIFMVFANNVDGKEAEFNAWYDRHMKAIVQLPGFVRAQRFLMQPRNGRPDPAYRYVIFYELRGDANAVIAEIGRAVKEGKVEAPDPAFVLKTDGMVYKPITQAYQR